MLLNVLVGLAATGLAVVQVSGWLGLGSLFFSRSRGYALAAPAAVVTGAAISGAILAALCWAGAVQAAVAAGLLIPFITIGFRVRPIRTELAQVRELWTQALAARPVARGIAVATVLLLWVLAIAPPRDADVLRYHLAHLRQILQDHAWLPIPDYHYALPFGWTINFLAFEALHIPEAGQIVNLLAFGLTVAGLFHIAQWLAGERVAVWLAAFFIFQPIILKGATTAAADACMLLIVVAVVSALVGGEVLFPVHGMGLGFLAWIGLQSRYQAAAIGLVLTAVWLLGVWRGRIFRPLSFLFGIVVAAVLCGPFYLFNARAFGNPFWPIFVGPFQPTASYADLVALRYSLALGGTLTFDTVVSGIRRALTSPESFPWPIVCALVPLAAWRRRSLVTTQLLVVIAGYLAIWISMQPNVYPRFFIYLAPPALMACAVLASDVDRWIIRAGSAGRLVAWLPLVALMAGCLAYSRDAAAYFVTRDTNRYHTFTWFYEPEVWLNQHADPDDRVLVVLNSAQSYYLNRANRRADPCWSGVVDWPAMVTPADLGRELRAGGFRYILYGDQDWSYCPGGAQLMHVLAASAGEGVIREVQTFDISLSLLRVLRRSTGARVTIFEIPR